MSTTQSPKTYTCSYCDGPRSAATSVRGSFCSRQCYLSHKGSKALDQLDSDHRICPSCFALCKTVHRPSDEALEDLGVPETIRDIFRGYQYATEDGAFHEDYLIRERAESEVLPPQKAIGRIGCRCGTVDLQERELTLTKAEGAHVILRLVARLRELSEEGALEASVDSTALVEAYTDRGSLVYAIGVGLHGGDT